MPEALSIPTAETSVHMASQQVLTYATKKDASSSSVFQRKEKI